MLAQKEKQLNPIRFRDMWNPAAKATRVSMRRSEMM
jgi:hypothetical protein